MYNVFSIAFHYAKYYITSLNGRGHGIHSPFVFELVTKVFNDKTNYPVYYEIEKLRQQLKQDNSEISVRDFGAGSVVLKSSQRKISSIAGSSLKPKKYAQLLYRLVRYFKPATILELGTSLGLTTAYMASAMPGSKLITHEGDQNIATVAKQNFDHLKLQNIKVKEGDFAATLDATLAANKLLDFSFVDGNHRKEPTLDYFNKLLDHSNEHSVIVFDDIHWSREMEEAWEQIKASDSVTMSIDLFFIGLVFFKKGFHHKQHFVVRF